MRWDQIEKFPHINAEYDMAWDFIEKWITDHEESDNLQINPDFQRGHIWTEAQQIAYVEYMLKCPKSGREIYFNHPGWMGGFEGEFVLVDGLQRLQAVRRYMKNEIPAFGVYLKDITEYSKGYPSRGGVPHGPELRFNIACLQTRAEVLQWYIDFNVGGTPHSQEEIEKVRGLLEKEGIGGK